MRKFFFVLLSIFLLSIVNGQQKELHKKLGEYFPVSPFGKNIDSIINFYQQNENFTIDSLVGKTDTSKFYLRGWYRNFSPFSFQTNKALILLRESDPRYYSGMLYEVAGYIDSSAVSEQPVKQEASLIYKKLRHLYNRIIPNHSRKKDKNAWGVDHYYTEGQKFPALFVAWGYQSSHYASGHYIHLQLFLTLANE